MTDTDSDKELRFIIGQIGQSILAARDKGVILNRLEAIYSNCFPERVLYRIPRPDGDEHRWAESEAEQLPAGGYYVEDYGSVEGEL